MAELLGTPEEIEKSIEERIVSLRRQIEDAKAETHHRIQRIEYDSRQRIRDEQRDFFDRVNPLQRELDGLLKVSTLKYVFATTPPAIVDVENVSKLDGDGK